MWGLANYLILEKSFGVAELQDAAYEWLRFIRPDYYVSKELINRGLDPATYGLTDESSCYSGRCELPFNEGGCGGMKDLKR